MPRGSGVHCSVCAHAQLAVINAQIRSGPNWNKLSLQMGLSRQALYRHAEKHPLETPDPDPALIPAAWAPAPDPTLLRPAAPTNTPASLEHPPGPPVLSRPKVQRVRRKPPTPLEDAAAKGTFLGAFKTSGDFDGAAEIAGVSRMTVRKWLEHDETFSLRFNQTRAELVEHLEATAVERATKGGCLVRKSYRNGHLYEEIHEWRPSDAALIKLLSSLKPEVYGDKLQITQTAVVKAVEAEAWSAV